MSISANVCSNVITDMNRSSVVISLDVNLKLLKRHEP